MLIRPVIFLYFGIYTKVKSTTEKKTRPAAKGDVKTSTANLFLNILIFLLGAIILYMAYSITIKILKDDSPSLSAQDGSKAADIVQVEVLNGCGVGGVADRFTDYLRNNKFDVVNISNYTSFDIDKTLVIDRTGNMANAEKVADVLGVDKKNIVQQINNDYFLDVSLVIGKDYNSLKPLK